MPKYLVEVPIAGIVWTEVIADNEKDAMKKAFESEFNPEDIEYELHNIISEGNIFHGMKNRISARLIKDDEEEV